MADYEPTLGGVADRMRDQAQADGCRFLFQVGELIGHIHGTYGDDEAATALACSVAFAWMLDRGAA